MLCYCEDTATNQLVLFIVKCTLFKINCLKNGTDNSDLYICKMCEEAQHSIEMVNNV